MNRLVEYENNSDSEGTDNEDEDYVPAEQEEELSEDEDDEDSGKPETDDGSTISSVEDEKKRGDELWADFLKEVEVEKNKKPVETQNGKKELKIYDFAGERVQIKETGSSKSIVDKSNGIHPSNSESSLSKDHTSTSSPPLVSNLRNGTTPRLRNRGISFLSGDPMKIGLGSGKRGMAGLEAVKNALKEKKQKMGTLEKSRYDWESFKESEGIEEELQTQVKGRDGFLERQEFLQRADLRQFEIEKNMRVKSRRNP